MEYLPPTVFVFVENKSQITRTVLLAASPSISSYSSQIFWHSAEDCTSKVLVVSTLLWYLQFELSPCMSMQGRGHPRTAVRPGRRASLVEDTCYPGVTRPAKNPLRRHALPITTVAPMREASSRPCSRYFSWQRHEPQLIRTRCYLYPWERVSEAVREHFVEVQAVRLEAATADLWSLDPQRRNVKLSATSHDTHIQ